MPCSFTDGKVYDFSRGCQSCTYSMVVLSRRREMASVEDEIPEDMSNSLEFETGQDELRVSRLAR